MKNIADIEMIDTICEISVFEFKLPDVVWAILQCKFDQLLNHVNMSL